MKLNQKAQKAMGAENRTAIQNLRNAGYRVRIEKFRYFERDVRVLGSYGQVFDCKEISRDAYPVGVLGSFNDGVDDKRDQWRLSNNGGYTVVSLEKEGQEPQQFESKCFLGDEYQRKLGVNIALKRALKEIA